MGWAGLDVQGAVGVVSGLVVGVGGKGLAFLPARSFFGLFGVCLCAIHKSKVIPSD